LVWWSALLAHRYALSWDYSLYNQAMYLISHGDLNPYSSTYQLQFWQNNGELIFWALAAIKLVWASLTMLKVIQVLAFVAAQVLALQWISELAASYVTRRGSLIVANVGIALGLVLLIANPWYTHAAAFDAHVEPFVAPLFVLAVRDLHRGRMRRGVLWLALALSGGVVCATYVSAVGVSLIFYGRRWWKVGVLVAVAGFVWVTLLHAAGAGTSGAGTGQLYGYILTGGSAQTTSNASLVGLIGTMLTHPGRLLHVLSVTRLNLWAAVSSAGIVGILWLPVLVPSAAALLEGGLTGNLGFSYPGYQGIVAELFIAIGTVVVLFAVADRLRRLWRWLPIALSALVAANTVVWGAIWIPQAPASYSRVSASMADAIGQVRADLGRNDEVVVEQGIIGAFSDRRWAFPIFSGGTTVRVHARHVWVVFAPAGSIETADIDQMYADIAQLSHERNMRLVVARAGVWAFEWTPPKGTTEFSMGQRYMVSTAKSWQQHGETNAVSRTSASIPAWEVVGTSGEVVKHGPIANWYAASNGKNGYVVSGAYFIEPPGHYTAEVKLSTTASANVELWDATDSVLLGRTQLGAERGVMNVQVPGSFSHLANPGLFYGHGIWKTTPRPAKLGDDLEVRVWTAGQRDATHVYTVALK
jgi:hypothetical protein